jgi:uncharacterized protein YdaU (DUF1376 family)
MHYYRFNIADYRKDTGHLSTMEHGIYRQLIDWYFLDEKPIPKETQVVMRRLRLGSDDLHLLQNVLEDFFNLTENGYVHSRIEYDLNEYQTQFAKNRVNGKQGGRPKKTQVVLKNNPSETQNNPNHKPITNNHKPITNVVARGTRLANDWILPDEYAEFCKTERPELNAIQVSLAFKDFWISKAGKDGVKLDWFATWRNWVRNQKSNGANKPMKGHGVISDADFKQWLEPERIAK